MNCVSDFAVSLVFVPFNSVTTIILIQASAKVSSLQLITDDFNNNDYDKNE